MKGKEGLSENMENYLEVILRLQKRRKVARSKDIAKRLGVLPGSVSGALKTLKDLGLVNYEPYSFVTLTPKGARIAQRIERRHAVLKNFLLNVLRIDPDTAEETACRLEHAVDELTVDRLVCFIDYIHACPRAGDRWLDSFIRFCETQEMDEDRCDLCVAGIQSKPPPEAG
jgi:DtxR family Mn-dependent transcriptional regulator